jgi:hypothetical protein
MQWSPRARACGKSWKRRLARIVHRPSDCQTMALRGTPHDCVSFEEERQRGYWLSCCGKRGASSHSTAKSMKRGPRPGRGAHYAKLCSRHPIASCSYSRARGTATANPLALCPAGNRPKVPWRIGCWARRPGDRSDARVEQARPMKAWTPSVAGKVLRVASGRTIALDHARGADADPRRQGQALRWLLSTSSRSFVTTEKDRHGRC